MMETITVPTKTMSPPARGRGLKHGNADVYGNAEIVAPRAGAWIETTCAMRLTPGWSVAPRAGAWIET